MTSTYSDLKFELIGTGEQSGTWGVTTNTNLGTAIEEAITGSADVTFASATVTLTLTDTNASQTARNLRLNLTGTSGGAQDLVVPAIEKFYIVNNGCADTITVKVTGQTGVGVPAGKAMLLFNNGTDVVNAVNHFDSLTLTNALAVAQGGTGATTASGARTNLGLGTIATQASDNVTITGGSVTGITDLAVADGGTGASDAAAARTNLGLGTIATQASDNVTITGGSVTGITDITVADGGTGASSLTTNAVLIGAGTSPITTVSPGTSGNVLTSDGTNWASTAPAGGGGFSSMTVFTNSGQFNSTNVDTARVTVVGGGGGGGGYTRGYDPESNFFVQGGNRSGGAGGGTAIEYVDLSGVNSVAVTVANGGGGGSGGGGTGGTSSFGAYCSATGGGGGQTAGGNQAWTSPTTSPTPGIGQGGNINHYGGSAPYKTGGNSAFGGGARTNAPVDNFNQRGAHGVAGYVYGGGGSSASNVGSSNQNFQGQGGAGAKGVVIIEY